LGNIEKITVFFFIPYIFEVILKIRGGLKKQSFAKVSKDGYLEMPYKKIYSLTHLSIFVLKKLKPDKKVHEREVVLLINLFQVFIILLGLLLLI
jgi:UDP-N-acetylmuramyl pentapeptide phosphotransferase/UDP-N-acetylglucosamine-1-phosphate transferase